MIYVNCAFDFPKATKKTIINDMISVYGIDSTKGKLESKNDNLMKLYKLALMDDRIKTNIISAIVITIASINIKDDHKFSIEKLNNVSTSDIYAFYNHLRTIDHKLSNEVRVLRHLYFRILGSMLDECSDFWKYGTKEVDEYLYKLKHIKNPDIVESVIELLSSSLSLDDINALKTKMRRGEKKMVKNHTSYQLI